MDVPWDHAGRGLGSLRQGDTATLAQCRRRPAVKAARQARDSYVRRHAKRLLQHQQRQRVRLHQPQDQWPVTNRNGAPMVFTDAQVMAAASGYVQSARLSGDHHYRDALECRFSIRSRLTPHRRRRMSSRRAVNEPMSRRDILDDPEPSFLHRRMDARDHGDGHPRPHAPRRSTR